MNGGELIDSGGGNPDCQGLESTLAAFINGDTGLIKAGRVTLHNLDHIGVQFRAGLAQYFDGVILTGELNFGVIHKVDLGRFTALSGIREYKSGLFLRCCSRHRNFRQSA